MKILKYWSPSAEDTTITALVPLPAAHHLAQPPSEQSGAVKDFHRLAKKNGYIVPCGFTSAIVELPLDSWAGIKHLMIQEGSHPAHEENNEAHWQAFSKNRTRGFLVKTWRRRKLGYRDLFIALAAILLSCLDLLVLLVVRC